MAGPQVIIIGAGIIGCAIALQLGRRGFRTLNVDKQPEVGFGSTANSCAIVRFSYSTFEGVTLAYEGYHYWRDWEKFIGVKDERGLAKFVQCGQLMLKTTPDERAHLPPMYRDLGIEFEEWDVATIRERLPIYSVQSFYPPVAYDDPAFWKEPEKELAGGLFTPQAGYVPDPQLATHNLRRAVEAQGGQFLLGRRVVAINREKDRVSGVTLDDGTRIDAPIVVNVAGPHSSIINRMAGVEQDMSIRTRALRREVHHLTAPAHFDFERRGVVTADTDTGVYFRPHTGNAITLGSGDPPCDPKVWVDDPDQVNREITEAQWNAQVYRLAKRIPDLGIPGQARGVVDMYDVSDDWIPIYDRSGLPGFYMAIGTSGHQFKTAGAVGTLMADLIEACEQGHDHDRDPLRHRCRYIGRELNLGAFSRLRRINSASSFSVRG